MQSRYKLKLFISMKFITANVMDQNTHKIVAQASTVEHALKRAFELGKTTNPTAGAVVGEVLARRLKVEALDHYHHQGVARGIYADVHKLIEDKGVENGSSDCKIVWAIINGLRSNGVKVVVDDEN